MKPIKSFFLSLVLAAFIQPVSAQNGIVRLDDVNDSIMYDMFTTAFDGPGVVHLVLERGLLEYQPFVRVRIGNNLYRFMFDTGCSQTLFHSQFAPAAPGDSLAQLFGVESHGKKNDVYGIARIDNIKIGELETGPVMVPLMDLGYGGAGGTHGVFGMAQLVNYDIIFDWKDKSVLLIHPNLTDSVISRYFKEMTTVPISVNEDSHLIFVESQVRSRFKTRQYSLVLDTGSEPCIIPEEAKPFLYRPSFFKAGDWRPKLGRTTIMLGDKKYRHVKTVFRPSSTYTEHDAKQGIDGVVGLKVIGKQPILISTKDNQLLILKRRK